MRSAGRAGLFGFRQGGSYALNEAGRGFAGRGAFSLLDEVLRSPDSWIPAMRAMPEAGVGYGLQADPQHLKPG